VIIVARRTRRVPRWYRNRVMRRVLGLIAENPGFHRLVIHIENADTLPHETGYLVDPNVEPLIREELRRVLVLAPIVEDPEPWAAL
jgi:hypothetical protein